MLYIVSTPIGNLKDITLRALEVLQSADCIAAEDTRHTRLLTSHYKIGTPLTSYFEHNKLKKAGYLMDLLRKGRDVALVTDAGTPGISDPGYHLIRLARRENIPVTAVPGPTALAAALSVSALPAHAFVFEGFLPVKKGARQKRLMALAGETRTVVLYESPHRLLKALEDIRDTLNDPVIVCARELTKKFEEVRTDRTSGCCAYFSKNKPRGEFVILFNLDEKSGL